MVADPDIHQDCTHHKEHLKGRLLKLQKNFVKETKIRHVNNMHLMKVNATLIEHINGL